MKNCSRCQEVKQTEEFSKDKRRSDGLASWCKPCSNEVSRERRSKTLPPNDSRHGTHSGYVAYGCRCEPCKAAKSKYDKTRSRRLKQEGLSPDSKKHGTHAGYLHHQCRCDACVAAYGAYQRKRTYGFGTVEEAAFTASTHCEICQRSFDAASKKCVDHCHTSGKVRGVLCGNCNTALGLLGDSIESAQRLTAYLIQHAEQ